MSADGGLRWLVGRDRSGQMKSPNPFGLSLSKPSDKLRANGSNVTGPNH